MNSGESSQGHQIMDELLRSPQADEDVLDPLSNEQKRRL
jgi:hypothetical protein